MKLAAGVEYRGTSYAGWQRQHHAVSVQEHVEQALSKVADRRVMTVCAGRTDTGVHAIQQVIHFTTDAIRSPHSWVLGANANLRGDVCLRWAIEVEDGFHARFSALSRTYRYVILNRKYRPSISRGLVTWEHRLLDAEAMAAAGSELTGRHDFTSYRAIACQAKHPVREIRKLEICRTGQFVLIEIQADGFLHHMVRNIAGVLMAIGKGDRKPCWAKEVLEARDRNQGGVTAPPDGLYLIDVEYPEKYRIPAPENAGPIALLA
ncbi:MAG: tRNA pseudouridine(38-40) synthase TruA [Gammaproteobacteria bacterium]|nr:MAG: tRNA pseudouridine(38-40) synthase TruA [Gammaproteobacteria bacterium]